MIGKEDLGLSLSLSSPTSHFSTTQLNLMPAVSSAPRPALPFSTGPRPAPQWSDIFLSHPHSERRNGAEARSLFKGIDVNQVAEKDTEEEEPAASSPNSTVSSVSGKRAERDPSHGLGDELDVERTSSRGMSDEEDGDGCRKKLRLSKDQSAILEESFKEHNTLSPKQKMALAKQLNLRPRQVEVWFQNRRARTKLKQTEVDCEFLKRCCENLTEENRRLQKEVQELRALKLSPQFYMHMTPPTTLTMCPSCERVSNSTNTTTSSSSNPSPMPILAGSEHHHQFLHHPRSQTAAPWGPIALRGAFPDAPTQRS